MPDFLSANANRIIASDLWTRNRPLQWFESIHQQMRPSSEANPLDSEFVHAILDGLFGCLFPLSHLELLFPNS